MRDWLRRVPRGVFLALALAQVTVLTALSHVPGEKLPSQGWFLSWVFNFAHAPMYFALAAFLAGSVASRDDRIAVALPLPRAVIAGAVAFGYGLFDEWHQSFVSRRASDVVDLVTDLAGIVAALVVARFVVDTVPGTAQPNRLVLLALLAVAMASAALAVIG